jgi:exodeoxyribonuclease-1
VNSEFRERVSHLFAVRYEDQAEPSHIEQCIYSGFPSNADQTRMHSFHGQGWDNRVGSIREIEDDRYRRIGHRIVAVERPDLLTEAQSRQWEVWCRERFLTNEKVPWMTVSSALEELADLTEDATSTRQTQLTDLQRFLKGLGFGRADDSSR